MPPIEDRADDDADADDVDQLSQFPRIFFTRRCESGAQRCLCERRCSEVGVTSQGKTSTPHLLQFLWLTHLCSLPPSSHLHLGWTS